MRIEDLRPHLVISDNPTVRLREYEGGGGTFPRESYEKYASGLKKNADQLKAIFAKFPSSDTGRLYYRIELPESQSVLSTTGQRIERDFHVKLLASPKKNVGHVSTSSEGFSMLMEQIHTYSSTTESSGKSKFAILESIGPIPAEEKISSSLKGTSAIENLNGEALITIFPDLSKTEQEKTKKAINDYLKDKGGSVGSSYQSDEGLIFSIKIESSLKALNDLAEAFPMVQSIDPVEEVMETSAVVGSPLPLEMEVIPNVSTAKVCIFDSGVVKNTPSLAGSIIAYEEPLGPPYSNEHGTFVASRIIYGDSLRDQIAAEKLTPDVKVLSVCMISHNDIGNRIAAKGDEFLRIIRDTVKRWHKEIKVYNVSMNLVLAGTHSEALVTDDNVGIVAAEIDKLSKEFDVLFVITTGNIPISSIAPIPEEPYPDYFIKESSRLCRPAEAMLALTVGSIATLDNEASMAVKSMPSPFTRRGPGFSGYRKPDLTAHGGNLTKNWKPFNELSVAGLSKDGMSLAYGNGTSYAAPLISRLAALLYASVPNASTNLVRAMLVHFTIIPDTERLEENQIVQLFGNGFVDSSRLLASNRWDQSYLFQGKVGFREILELPFYIPDSLANRKGRNKLRIRVTVVFSPETNRVLKKGYCKSHLQTKIQKIGNSGDIIDVPVGDSQEVINDKYSTIVRCDKSFSTGVGGGDWRLVIEHKSRWTLKNPETPFAAIVSVIDPKNEPSTDIAAMIKANVPNRYQPATKVMQRIRV